jgi:hypothetical protein
VFFISLLIINSHKAKTATFMSFNFPPHGTFSLKISNNIIVARLAGSWNKECAQNYAQDFKSIAHQLSHQSWGHLVYLDDWELGVPEMTPIIQDLVDWCTHNGLKKSAQIYCQSMTKRYSLDKMIIERCDDFERQIFADELSAISWLDSYGFTLSPSNESSVPV